MKSKTRRARLYVAPINVGSYSRTVSISYKLAG